MKKGKITVSENGPYLVLGNFPLEKEIFVCGSDGIPIKWKKEKNIIIKIIVCFADVDILKTSRSVTERMR